MEQLSTNNKNKVFIVGAFVGRIIFFIWREKMAGF